MGEFRAGKSAAVRGALWRLVAGMGVTAILATGLVAVTPADSSSALSGSEFQPGRIISDTEFYKGDAMTEAQIQSLLDAKIGACFNAQCLNVLRHTMPSKVRLVSSRTGDLRCDAFQGGTDLRASTIIYRAQVACGISAKVILVTLQKEQALATSRAPSKATLDRAMGYACPDTAPCAVTSLGFGNQVYMGALQLKTYKTNKFGMQPGTHTIGWHPSASCGSSTFVVENYATAALYNYTPYRPNTAAINNLGGRGDACSSYGNRNFWVFYYSWFGNPNDITPSAAVARVGGADRYVVAATLAQQNFPTAPVTTVYIATGLDFPDGLSASAAAAHAGAPLLLVKGATIPAEIRAQLVRLKPQNIVVSGGAGIVPDSVYTELAKFATTTIRRDAGADRYETSRIVARAAFATATTAYIATGADFPDALSASAAAATVDAPVILVPGYDTAVDEATLQVLRDLGVTSVTIAGGAGAVSAGIEAQLKGVLGAGKVLRHGGADRYAVSEAINRASFDTSDKVYIATGSNFPDALAGAAVAGGQNAPLYVVRGSCFPKNVLQDIVDSGAKTVVLLGGTAVLSSDLARWANCP